MKRILSVFAVLLMAWVQTAVAADAQLVVLETDATQVSALGPAAENVINCRVIFLDANGEAATNVSGQDITVTTNGAVYDAQIGDALGAADADKVLPMTTWWKEFKVAYDSEMSGTDTISVSGLGFADSQVVTIVPAEANCYGVVTGTVATMPGAEELIPAPQDNGGAQVAAGTTITVNIFAAYKASDGSTYYVQDLPANAEEVILTATSGGVTLLAQEVTLVNGAATVSVQISDLKLDKIALANGTTVEALLQADPADAIEVSFAVASEIYVRGDTADELDASGRVTINMVKVLSSGCQNDTADIAPGAITSVQVVPLPVNVIDDAGQRGFAGFGVTGVETDASVFMPSQFDAFMLAEPLATTQELKADAEVMFGAVMGFDAYGNPSLFNETTIVVSASSPLGIDVSTIYVSSTGSAPAGMEVTTVIAPTVFAPFQVDTAPVGVDPLDVTVDGAATWAAAGPLDGQAQFSSQDTISDIAITGLGTTAGSAIVGNVTVNTDAAADANYLLTAVNKTDGLPVNLTASGVPAEAAADAAADVPAYTTAAQNDEVLVKLQGETTGTVALYPLTLAAAIDPADPAVYSPSSIEITDKNATASLGQPSGTDRQDVLSVTDIVVYDAFGNPYADLDDAQSGSELSADFTTLGGLAFTGFASAAVETNGVALTFDPELIPAGTTQGELEVSWASGLGTRSDSVAIALNAVQASETSLPFAPVIGPDISLPVKANMIDQNDAFIAPVADTAGAGVDVTVAVSQYSVSGSPVNLTAAAPVGYARITSIPEDVTPGTALIVTSTTADYAAGAQTEFELSNDIDATAPVIGDVTAADCGFTFSVTDETNMGSAVPTITLAGSSGNVSVDASAITAVPDAENKVVAFTVYDITIPEDTYDVTIVAQDAFGNSAQRIAEDVTIACTAAPECLTVDPAVGSPGQQLTVTITGVNTDFADASATDAVTFSCDGVTVDSVTGVSATELQVEITIASDATAGDCTVTVGDLTCPAFTVLTRPDECVVSTDTIDEGVTTRVTLTLPLDYRLTRFVRVSSDLEGAEVKKVDVDTQGNVITVDITPPVIEEDTAMTLTAATLFGGSVECGPITVVDMPTQLSVFPGTVRSHFLMPRFVRFQVSADLGFVTVASDVSFTDDTGASTTDIIKLFVVPGQDNTVIYVWAVIIPRTSGSYNLVVDDNPALSFDVIDFFSLPGGGS